MDTKIEDVEKFLQEFKQKMKIFGVIILRDRSKNLQTILDLELTNVTIRNQLTDLTYKDFYKGPTKDNNEDRDLWEFGKTIKKKEVYIKITIGKLNKSVICVSFHFPEKKIKYPFK